MSKNKKRRLKKKSPPGLMMAPRNPFANHPLMKKGGIHQKSKSACRAADRREVKNMTRDWSSFLIKILLIDLKG